MTLPCWCWAGLAALLLAALSRGVSGVSEQDDDGPPRALPLPLPLPQPQPRHALAVAQCAARTLPAHTSQRTEACDTPGDHTCDEGLPSPSCCDGGADGPACSSVCECVRRLSRARSADEDPDWTGRDAVPKPLLHCREHNLLSVSWEGDNQTLTLPDDTLYVVEYRARAGTGTGHGHDPGAGPWLVANLTHCRIGAVTGLRSNSSYQVRVRAVGPRGQRAAPALSDWLHTTPDHFMPDRPDSVQLVSVNYLPNADDEVQANITWTPGNKPACRYSAKWFSSKVQEHGIKEYTVFCRHRQGVLTKLLYEDKYYVGVDGCDASWKSSPGSTYLENGLQTKPCFEAHHHNLSVCRPARVEGLSAREELTSYPGPGQGADGRTLVDVTVSWTRPDAEPLEYQIELWDPHVPLEQPYGPPLLGNSTVNGNETSAVIRNVSVGKKYMVTIWAVSVAGKGKERHLVHEVKLPPGTTPPAWDAGWLLTMLLVGMAVPGAAVLGVLYFWRQRGKAQDAERRRKYFEELEVGFKENPQVDGSNMHNHNSGGNASLLLSQPVVDEWEIPRSSLLLGEKIGCGNFGTVCKGLLTCNDRLQEVAVKKLRDDATPEEVRQFSLEITLMKSVGSHPHIVSMVGCCTRGSALLVVEYCALGDLQRFLRKAWKAKLNNDVLELKYATLSHSYSQDDNSDYENERSPPRPIGIMTAVSNATYGMDLETDFQQQNMYLTEADLLSMARQVAIGMEFLANSRVVHRDLAARNILVCADRTVKISDFGLSRDIYEQNIYRKTGYDKVPVKWMAVESLLHQEYTTQSDVWSFGVLLWEIVTLGGSPYPDVPNNGLFQYLSSGWRMERPASCSEQLYQIMRSCWLEKPSARPNFTQLKKQLDELLQDAGADYLQLDQLQTSNRPPL